jgi:peptidoglycan/LPS O-acetylase OafA/YrhL
VGIVHAAVVAKPPWRRVWDSLATSKPTHLLAEWSYGIYLFHMFCMALAGHLLTTLGAQVSQTAAFSIYVVVVVGSAVLLAACMHALVEKPARDFGKELSRRR